MSLKVGVKEKGRVRGDRERERERVPDPQLRHNAPKQSADP